VCPCGAGCTLGDIAAEFAVFGIGLTVAGTALPFEYIGDYLLAVVLGLMFQYFAIAPMRGLGFRDAMKAAAKADILSLSAFEVGLSPRPGRPTSGSSAAASKKQCDRPSARPQSHQTLWPRPSMRS
jgi:hypothetical protein